MFGWITRLKLLKISKYAIIICAVISAVFAAFSIYGSQVGNLTISINQSNVALALHDLEDLSNPKSKLTFPGMTNQDNATLDWFDDKIGTFDADGNVVIPGELINQIGENNDSLERGGRATYIAYTFILENRSNVSINADYSVNILRVTRGVDSAIRLMVICDGNRKIYAKPKEVGSLDERIVNENETDQTKRMTDYDGKYVGEVENYPYLTEGFTNNDIICKETIQSLGAGANVRFTVVLWLEGNDGQCDNTIRGGRLQINMNFNSY